MSRSIATSRARRALAAATASVVALSACGSSGTEVDTQAVADAVEQDTEQAAAPVATTAPIEATDTEAEPADHTSTGLTDDQPGMADDAMPADEAMSADAEGVEAEADDAAPEPTAAPAPVEAAAVELPSVPVVDLNSGATVDLASLSSPGATLLWFWAPH